ncbi:LysR family transcriptional regulator [Oceanobacter sp. 5_MG-2023]|jgi:LysR family nitrogen assimilation transcriptional regulator|uniref:LysR family transcriptional regulator n=1 Tax=Oceanobacter sp. 5_MG-2023 TaxID=3062645 RepID=UPI0026E413D3|nr:LysR family transcriptional regulator [Oceanobacter sp. 5_MG-2023]MDO6683181.1 LysR family transcriptional regulator [Oceanobacter sp. 5_MG-2023]
MNTRQLLYLVTCARTGSIAATARELNIAQPSVSQQLAALEHELKTRLLERDHTGVHLTPAGEKFLPVAETTVQQLELARRQLLEDGGEPSGRVVLGMSQPTGNALAVPLFAEVNRRYPGIELDLQTGLSSSLYQLLRQGDVDLLVSSDDASPHMGMISRPLLNERLFLAVGTGAAAVFDSLLQRDCIRFAELTDYRVIYTSERDSLGFRVAQYEQLVGVKLQRQNPFGQLLTSLRYVIEGYGLLICSTTAVYPQVNSGAIKLLPITDPDMTRQVNLVHMHERPETRAMTLVAELIGELSQQLIADGIWAASQP